jgi:hypothetical protein
LQINRVLAAQFLSQEIFIMTTLVIEHLQARDLPAQWLQQLHLLPEQTVTVRIETEATAPIQATASFVTDDPAFGIWRDHEDMADVEAYVRELRAPRYSRDGSRTEG